VADIDFEIIAPSAPQADDALVTRRGASAPNTGALTLTADLLARANHTGSQAIATVTGLQAALDGKQPLTTVLTNTTASYTTAEQAKLAAIAAGATANSTDAFLLARANHTGTQTAATIGDFTEAAQDATGAMIDGSLAYNDATPLLSRAALSGAITAAAGSNTTALGSFTKAQLDTAISDGNAMYIGDAPTAHTHVAADVTDFTASSRAQVEAALIAGTNVTLTPSGTGATRQITIAATGGGGGAIGGTASINFGGGVGTSFIETVITGQTGIGAGSRIKVWFQGDSTADHSAYVHKTIFPQQIALSASDIVAGVGFTINAITNLRLRGLVSCRWEWS